MVHFKTFIWPFQDLFVCVLRARVLLRTEWSREQCWELRCKGMITLFWYVFLLL